MLYVIINPKSKSGRTLRNWHQIEDDLKHRKVPYRYYMTRKRGDATTIASRLTRGNEKRYVLLLGGDGTLNEFLNGVRKPDNLILSYVPQGSGNDFAKGMGISKKSLTEARRALHSYENAKTPDMLDYGTLAYPDGTERRFFVSGGIGYDAKVCAKVDESKVKPLLNKIGLGKLIYLFIGVRYLLNAETFTGELYLDGEKTLEGDRFLFASWHNLPYEGGGFRFCPTADATDGKLNVCVAKDIPKWKIPFIIPLAKFGWHTKCKGVYQFQCESAVMKSTTGQYVHTDGETRDDISEIRVEVSPAQISFIR